MSAYIDARRLCGAKVFESHHHARAMKRVCAIPLVVTIALVVLFFFPKPASNIIAYFATMLVLGVFIVLTVRWAQA